jgi:ABC-type transport system substrate-binding protein
MRTSKKTVAIALAVAAGALLSASPAVAAPAPLTPDPASGPSATATFSPADGTAAVGLLDDPAKPAAAGAATAHESVVQSSVRQRLELLPGIDAGRLAQILKNLHQGAL